MYQNTNETEKPLSRKRADDEIDVRDILRGIKNIFLSIGQGISDLSSLIIKRFLLVFVLILAGFLLSYGAFYITKPYYTSSMTLMLTDIRNEFVEDQLAKLSDLIADDDFEAVATRLEIDLDTAKKIKKMEFSNLDQDRVDEDSILTGSPFRIELTLYDNHLFSTMEPALASYIENNRFFYKQKNIKKRQVESMINKYKNQIASIDSIKTAVIAPRGPVNGFVYGEPIDPTNLYRQSMTMYEEQVKLESELDQLNSIQVVTGFSPRRLPTGPNLLLFLFIGGLLGFLTALFWALKLESRAKKV
ncbi:chain length determinant protein [Pontibacter ruber]|uniref:Chain length determinant protein n=1 Tax=Pontibacter ruber TaxID=1343895 RepID=A0ABW5D2F7_9BACT|nr:chain length determinant protein [Pontibacter ruber]